MILAAGRGQRMMPLTRDTPKPLLPVNGKPLLQYHIENLRDSGINQLIINHCYLGQKIEDYFGDGSRFGVEITWSPENTALETAGGIRQVLDKLGSPFMVVNGDIWSDFNFAELHDSPHKAAIENGTKLAHLVLVANPSQNPAGDFGLQKHCILNQADTMWTFSGIALYHPALFANCSLGSAQPLAPLLREQAELKKVSGEIYTGEWQDIGTPQRLAKLQDQFNQSE